MKYVTRCLALFAVVVLIVCAYAGWFLSHFRAVRDDCIYHSFNSGWRVTVLRPAMYVEGILTHAEIVAGYTVDQETGSTTSRVIYDPTE